MRYTKKTIVRVSILLILVLSLVAAVKIVWSDNHEIEQSNYVLSSSKIAKEFDGYKILHISDLHGERFGVGQRDLMIIVRNADPDIIAFTGDLVDRENPRDKDSYDFIKQAVNVAPVYYIAGNHEWQSHLYESWIKPRLLSLGVHVLSDSFVELRNGEKNIALLGIEDFTAFTEREFIEFGYEQRLKTILDEVPEDSFKVLLSHRPEMIKVYKAAGIDMVLSGHTHGGQVKLPLIGTIFAPDQGLFPKYSDGRYDIGKTTLIVSRGLGKSVVPVRILCKPQLITITLHSTIRK
jgi:uncharacterized protein